MEREIRYCTTDDGVRIAYCVEGEGPDMVCCPGFIGSFSLDHLIEDQMGFWRGLWRGRRVVRYDMRGTGLSQRDVDEISHDAVVRDLRAVVRASGARQFTLWGGDLAGPRAIAYAAEHPRAVRRLVLHRTFARARDNGSEEQIRTFADLARVNWPTAAKLFADSPVRGENPDAGVHQAQQYIESASGDFVARMLVRGFETTDVTGLLSKVRPPTLIMHRADDPLYPLRVAQRLASAIPNARLFTLEQNIMGYLAAGRIGVILDALNEFIDDGARAPRRGERRGIQTVLFTDLVGHTEMMQRIGDTQGREVLREHERITRETLRAHGGAEVKSMGDGFMAAFTSVTDAIECAIALQRAFCARDEVSAALRIRVGLNAGEPIEDAGDLFGAVVILASRICAQAGGGEVLIPEPVRHLAAGKGFMFSDHGEFVPKGFDDAVRLFEVRWQQ